ncbi:MAG: hypothetical protein BIFFINMI_02298 [Phycisphaerae bacterium]|nr:hypothetical protein [Phycisphaerae bacterium]
MTQADDRTTPTTPPALNFKSLDAKLADIHANPSTSRAFILADAKDADMAFGIAAPGRSPEHADGQFRTLAEYRDHIRANVAQGRFDIRLMSVSTNELLTIRERIFDGSPVTPAIRANDTTDIHVARGASYPRQPALPFRTALLDHAQCGCLCPDDSQRHLGANLGLYSITFNNDAGLDRAALEAYRDFRVEAERKGFRHFLEVFDPNAPRVPVPPDQLGGFINDLIARTLAGVASPGRPVFLKVVYHGPRLLEELAAYDPHLVVGVLGGSAGTTYDAFKLLAEARAHGARAALFGRKINNAEHQLSFIQFLRWIADGEVSAEEAVRAYHGVLTRLGIRPHRPLADDLQLTDASMSYAGGDPSAARPAKPSPAPPADRPASPDFAAMTPQERLAYHRDRLDRMFG